MKIYWSILQHYIEYVVKCFNHKTFSTNCVFLNSEQSHILPYNNLYMYTPCLFIRIVLQLSLFNKITTLLCNVLADASNSHLQCFIITVYVRVNNNIDSGNKIHLLGVLSPSVCRTTAGVHILAPGIDGSRFLPVLGNSIWNCWSITLCNLTHGGTLIRFICGVTSENLMVHYFSLMLELKFTEFVIY